MTGASNQAYLTCKRALRSTPFPVCLCMYSAALLHVERRNGLEGWPLASCFGSSLPAGRPDRQFSASSASMPAPDRRERSPFAPPFPPFSRILLWLSDQESVPFRRQACGGGGGEALLLERKCRGPLFRHSNGTFGATRSRLREAPALKSPL